MLRSCLLALALVPGLVSAGIFPKDSQVTMLDPKGFKKAMKKNETSMVAFVAPWCGHCQRMAPEYSKAALGLYPMVPFYAVNCDDDKNKRLCAEQGVQGFPTVKLFPRGKEQAPMPYEGERSSSGFFYFASRRIPNHNKKFYKVEDIKPWMDTPSDKPRALLLTKDKKVPLLWQVLGNKYSGKIQFASHRDRKGKSSVALGYEAGGKKEPKVFVFAPGSTNPFRYEGINKLDSLSKFLDSVLDGTADLGSANEEAKAEEYTPSEEELEIERKQEAQRIALAHGGFSDLIDFEEALKNGGADFHDQHGFGMMGDIPEHLKKKKKETGDEDKATEGNAKEEAKAKAAEQPAVTDPVFDKQAEDLEAEIDAEIERMSKILESQTADCASPSATGSVAAGECAAPVQSDKPKDEL